jgi:hypothetical protein
MTLSWESIEMKQILLFILILTQSFAIVPPPSPESLHFQSDFFYAQAQLDSLIINSPRIIFLKEQIQERNKRESFWRNISFHMTYNPVPDPNIEESSWVGLGARISLGALFADTQKLDRVEIDAFSAELKIKTRELMKQRQELLFELQMEIQLYQTALMKLRKTEISLQVQQTSSDDVLDAKDNLARHLTVIRKHKSTLHLIEDHLKILIGEL